MSSTADAEAHSSTTTEQSQSSNHPPDPMPLPAARTMDDAQSDHTTTPSKDDPATMAASEELKHTTISDKVLPTSLKDQPRHAGAGEDKTMKETVKEGTPEADLTDAQDEEMRERITSPKKKRGRDQDEETRDLDDNNLDEPGSSADGSVINGSRTTRSGPEKKRPRDTSEDYTNATEKAADVKASFLVMATADTTDNPKPTSSETQPTKNSESSQKPIFGSGFGDKSQPSTSAFASSGFASLASSSTSPFGIIGATKPSVFGAAPQPAVSGFGALAAAKSTNAPSTAPLVDSTASSTAKPLISLGFGGGSDSGFGGLGGSSGSVFGSRLGNGFAGGSGAKLSSFAAPGTESITTAKPAKAFGAPESDNEGSDQDDSEGNGASDDEEGGNVGAEDKKKTSKVSKVHIEDGESGEATLLQMRAKLFAIDSKEVGWKERGVGTLKINVPKPCVDFDENGVVIPGSFDASGLEDEDEDSAAPRVARLIMRQENTHRVVLNTVIVRAMEFNDKPSNSSAQIIFTAFEGDKEPKPINMLLKMSEANARSFRSEIESIQHEL
ncbi:Nucleoporin [Lachnellula occidentalis]|uniref:Nucleoporin n=1 Tax=Lachnellula occidentalis TaxID=215460 RepID=A0A8H8S9Q5_9HELO|nr:Nucleoporin [Lachnellula occidentalis]